MGHSPQTSYRADIDGLRAIAVLGVVAYHAAPRLLPGGFVGVDVFFVISGFLISTLIVDGIERGSFSFLDFYRRRIRRILPSLIVVIAAVWFIGFFALWPNQFADLGLHILAASIFSSNILLALQAGYFDTVAQAKPLLHLWSLAIEEQFYLVWPVMVFMAAKFRWNVPALLCVLFAASFASGAASLASQSPWAFYGPQNRAWELALGAILAVYCKPQFVPAWMRSAAAAAGLALIAIAMVWFGATSPYPGWRALAPTVGAALLILAGPHAPVGRVLSAKPIVAVGLISYPLYLWHWPLLSFTHIVGIPLTPLVAAANVGCAFLLAWLTYHVIELPIRMGKSISLRRFVPAGLAALLIGAGMLGAATQWGNGLAFRLDGAVKELASFHFDQSSAYRDGTCLLGPEQDERGFASNCVDAAGAPLVLLWGDSHAAHLYPGLKALQATSPFSLAQFTASACPPILDVDVSSNPHCRLVNGFVVRKVTELRPKIVLLAASWWGYPGVDLSLLRHSVDRLRGAGVDRIILVGPVPVWTPSLPEALLNYYKKNNDIPDRMTAGLTKMTDIDENLGAMALQWGVTYFSALDAMCDAAGCLTRTSADMHDLTAWDSAHLTSAGSRYLAGKMPLFEAKPPGGRQ